MYFRFGMYLLSGSHRWMPILESIVDVAKTTPDALYARIRDRIETSNPLHVHQMRTMLLIIVV